MLDNDNNSGLPDLAGFFESRLDDIDPAISSAIRQELSRQKNQIELKRV